MVTEMITLDQFRKLAPASVEAFAIHAEWEIAEEGQPSTLTESEWWDWMAAYYEYVELSEELTNNRRATVDRRVRRR